MTKYLITGQRSERLEQYIELENLTFRSVSQFRNLESIIIQEDDVKI